MVSTMKRVVGVEIVLDGKGEYYLLQLDCGHGAQRRVIWKDGQPIDPPKRVTCPTCKKETDGR